MTETMWRNINGERSADNRRPEAAAGGLADQGPCTSLLLGNSVAET